MTNKKNITIKIENEDLVAPLYMQYSGQCNPQPAYIEIDPSGGEIEITAEINTNIGPGCSQDAFNGVVNQISCPCYVLGSELKNYLESDEFAAKCRAMCEGYKCEWDGSNHRGHWRPNVWQLEEDIRMDLLSLESVEIYDGDEWIEGSITYYSEDGEKVNYAHEATSAVYEAETNIEITKDNLDALVKDSEKYIDLCCQLVEDIEGAFERIIEEIENNKE